MGEKTTRAGWIGTSTHAQLNLTIGRIETSTRSATTLARRIGTSTQATQHFSKRHACPVRLGRRHGR